MRSRFSTTLEDSSTRANWIGWGRRHFRRCDWWRWRGRAWDGRNFSAAKIWRQCNFCTSAWLLSQSGTVANRLGQVLEKQGQPEKARHMYALAVAAGGSDVAGFAGAPGKAGWRCGGGGERSRTGAGGAGAGTHGEARRVSRARQSRRGSISCSTARRVRSVPSLLTATRAFALRASNCARRTFL